MENQRIRLSKAMLKEALLKLLERKPIEKISIYELCATAQINRTTFYKYYGSQYDLLAEIEAELFAKLDEKLKDASASHAENLCRALEVLLSEENKWLALINNIPDREFLEKLFVLPTIQTILSREIPDSFTGAEREYVYLFFCQGGYAIIRSWLNRADREPCEKIAALITQLAERLTRGS